MCYCDKSQLGPYQLECNAGDGECVHQGTGANLPGCDEPTTTSDGEGPSLDLQVKPKS